MNTIYLFVYGTLKRGQPQNRLLEGEDFVGSVRTLPRYRLYANGQYPCLVEDEENGICVEGELWRVRESTLEKLDKYEGVPDLYERRAVAIQDCAEAAFAYFYQGKVNGLRECGRSY